MYSNNGHLAYLRQQKAPELLIRSDATAHYRNDTIVNQTIVDKTTYILRAVIEAQDGVSAVDILYFFAEYHGAPEGMELMLSQGSLEAYTLDFDESPYPILVAALRGYAARSQWEPLLRKLVRRGHDLHAPIVYWPCSCIPMSGRFNCFCSMPAFVRPLDGVFQAAVDPFNARDVGEAWLNILASEGHDVRAYLEKEKRLHTPSSQLIRPHMIYQSRQTLIELGEIPSVSWRWWYDPSCSAYLLHEKFANWNIHYNDPDPWYRPIWTDTWPFDFFAWVGCFARSRDRVWNKRYEIYNKWIDLHERSQRRAEKRLRKRAAKRGQLGGQKQSSLIPGSWPNE